MKHLNGELLNLRDCCVSFGYFDGLHKGHRAVIDTLLAEAGTSFPSVLLSFSRDEAEGDFKVLSTEAEKEYLLRQNGPDTLVSYPVLGEGELCTESFIRDILVAKLGAKALVVGKNHPSLALLEECSIRYQYRLVTCDTVMDEGEAVSSQRVSEALDRGDVETATRLLGHPYLFVGEIVYGKQLGRKSMMPTANLDYHPHKQLPQDGVYGTLSMIDGEKVKGLTNIGKRPSVDNFDYKTIETFLLDFSADIYGKITPLELHAYIRNVRKFNNLDEVKLQIDQDILSIRAYLETL